METAKQRIRVAAVAKKKEEEKARGEATLLSVPKFVGKAGANRKADEKDEQSGKKVALTSGGKPHKKQSPQKTSHGASKGLMTVSGTVAPNPVHHLLTHKDYAVEVAESILKEEKIELCDDQSTDEIGSSGLFDLSRVYFPLS